ncbi:hypothetical protein BJ986_002250 [Phycicoccus badiiscoriae]|uniref:Uncharacterized protein n=1 Tax=Pedococcus badiiscoriae TaxID=642776 RepID=A0A852WEV8_9MICO|nr:hypothetical protein [Pedococcus badiiscoriae]NYG07763.1 hypothetical protein [Pedococcus badiiscoriae]
MIELRWAFGHEDSIDSVVAMGEEEAAGAKGALSAILGAVVETRMGSSTGEDQLKALLLGGDYRELLAGFDGVAGRSGDEWFRFLSVATVHGGVITRAIGPDPAGVSSV